MNVERFKDIEGYEGLYQISNLGNVKSLNYGRTGEEKLLKPAKKDNGYLFIGLHKNGNVKFFLIHRLVALAFIPNPLYLKEINHINEDKTDNCVNNLEWISHKDNMKYGTRIVKELETKSKKGSVNAEKPVVQYTKNMIEVGRYKSLSEASRQTNISDNCIGSCCRGKLKSCGGYIWKYL